MPLYLIEDSAGLTKTHTGVHTRDRDEVDGITKTLTGVLKILTGTAHGGHPALILIGSLTFGPTGK